MLIWTTDRPDGSDAVRVQGGLLVAFDNAGAQLFAQVCEGADQEGGLACSGGTHDVQCPDSATFQPAPVPRREQLVLLEQALLERDGFRMVVMVMVMVMRVLVPMGVLVVVGVLMLMVMRVPYRDGD